MTLTRKLDISSVGQLQAETIGLPWLSGLWIFGKKYITGVLGVVVNRLEAEAGKSPAWMKWLMVLLTVFWWERVGSEFNLVWKEASLSCRSASCLYKSALQTTTAPPLSAGFITTSFRLRNDLKAKRSSVLRLKGLFRR